MAQAPQEYRHNQTPPDMHQKPPGIHQTPPDTHVSVIFEILEPSAFKKYSIFGSFQYFAFVFVFVFVFVITI